METNVCVKKAYKAYTHTLPTIIIKDVKVKCFGTNKMRINYADTHEKANKENLQVFGQKKKSIE